MNATDLGLLQWLPSFLRRPQLPVEGGPTPADAGTDPGAAIELPSQASARPVTALPDDTAAHVLHLVDEYGGLIRQEMQYKRLAGANKYDPNIRNAEHAADLQRTYYDDIRAHLNGSKR